MNAISQTHFQLPQQTAFYRGKVRDVYTINNAYLVMVVSDRISAFDVVLPKPIPYKGQVLNQIAAKFLQATSHIVPNWVVAVPDPNVTIGKMCTPFKVEMVIRGYLAGHAYREYTQGKRTLCGITLPDGLKENDPFPAPIITPTTKESVGHDEDISKEKILEQGIVTSQDYEQLEKYTYALFKKGTEMASERGLILVDTKYEFGKTDDGKIYLIDEIHTPDSSRYFYKEGYEERQKNGEKQKQLSKEFVREWLIANNFQGKEGQEIPEMTDEIISNISERYIELYEKIIGENFQRADISTIYNRIENNILKALSSL
ncbi:MAG: phosphoribosylaminoimidazolesuccinocarboxamide synthase [Bacteroidetes bacterium]|nr:phosphoribosylaminoimidazolesuccinocarboxamide synthase [Bacteroidota bacterium]MBV6461987.1 Phosphoribosylaminoimidazole-succinocarboxamide synthase [Flavobacteriales bacterium]WKZ76618.1 MAG: phosphoribosylaminoimidazolesuccinocarboxamide synthase [Vicingaceae bacterium]MCL4815561.1 phosphoribosylaminoimidazolesuccinocarboxamide synthase [Flavobacteriales bacterium]NOG94301.1 phosphoribosylaminoimidazolesuccinocarboxamide synthase [Bacteroidota bacterium]